MGFVVAWGGDRDGQWCSRQWRTYEGGVRKDVCCANIGPGGAFDLFGFYLSRTQLFSLGAHIAHGATAKIVVDRRTPHNNFVLFGNHIGKNCTLKIIYYYVRQPRNGYYETIPLVTMLSILIYKYRRRIACINDDLTINRFTCGSMSRFVRVDHHSTRILFI